MKVMELSSVRCRYRLRLLVGIIFCLAYARPVVAQQNRTDSLSVTVAVDQERITIGDAFQYVVTVVSPLEAAMRWPDAGKTLDGFDILSFDHDGPYILPDGTHVDTLRYALTIYTTGVQNILPLSLSCILEDGSELFAVSDSIPITIVSVIDDEATDIRDLKNPVDIPASILWYIWVAGGVGLILLAGVIWFIIRRRRQRDEAVEAFVDSVRPPHERALDELDQLARFQWLAQGRVKTHYTALSEILRRYLSARYKIAAMEFTTTELMVAIRRLETPYDQVQSINRLLQESDMVKFAKFTPEPDPQSQSIQNARGIIEQTRLVEVETTDSDETSTGEVIAKAEDVKHET